MKCKNCGAPLVNGQIICSNCDTDNSTILTQTNDNMNNYQFNNEQIKNSNQGQNYGYNQTNDNINNYQFSTEQFVNNNQYQNYGYNQTNDNINNYQFSTEQFVNNNQNQNYGYNQTNENINYEEKKVSNKKQNIFLKIASILALFLGIALTIINILNLIEAVGLGRIAVNDFIGILISFIFLFYSFMLSNFNLQKSKIYDNKILFVVLLIVNVIACFFAPIYVIVLIFGVVGFIRSIIKNK